MLQVAISVIKPSVHWDHLKEFKFNRTIQLLFCKLASAHLLSTKDVRCAHYITVLESSVPKHSADLICLLQFIPSEAFECFYDEFVARCIRIHHSMAMTEELLISHLFIVHSVNAVRISYSTKFQRSPLASLNAFLSRARAKVLSLAGQDDVSLPAFETEHWCKLQSPLYRRAQIQGSPGRFLRSMERGSKRPGEL